MTVSKLEINFGVRDTIKIKRHSFIKDKTEEYIHGRYFELIVGILHNNWISFKIYDFLFIHFSLNKNYLHQKIHPSS